MKDAPRKRIRKCVKEFESAAAELVNAIADAFPLGSPCAIVRIRKGVPYQIRGYVYGHPKTWRDQRRLYIKTDSRGTVMGADYLDVDLEGR